MDYGVFVAVNRRI